MTSNPDLLTPPTGLFSDPHARRGRLPRQAPLIVGLCALGFGALVAVILSRGVATTVAVAVVAFLLLYPGWSRVVEGRRAAVDRLVGSLMWLSFGVAMVPLVSLISTVVVRGLPVLTPDFLTSDMSGRALLGEGGGIWHAIMGTIMVTALAAVIAVPVGILTAVWLIEYGVGSKLATVITFLVDVMTGIPSIVAGLFAVAFFQVVTGDGLPRLGIGGALALSLLMLPTVIRAVEEMLKLVPNDLREASYALGVPKWRTIVRVVLPTAVAGIVTGVTLAVARVAGETAPLLLILGTARVANWNPFDGAVQTLPVYIFQSMTQTSHFKYGDIWTDRVWGAALALVIIVMTLNVIARVFGRIFAPKGSGR
ncbi:MAG: phosphate ABC transporter permease PstA [Nocardioidaceae bacterium]|nr:phosphate ABC transporter permease PstA [Nocardioidaceae bacterium]